MVQGIVRVRGPVKLYVRVIVMPVPSPCNPFVVLTCPWVGVGQGTCNMNDEGLGLAPWIVDGKLMRLTMSRASVVAPMWRCGHESLTASSCG